MGYISALTYYFLISLESGSDLAAVTIRYEMLGYFNVRSKADMSHLNLPHGDDN